jgi:hypothetical protein
LKRKVVSKGVRKRKEKKEKKHIFPPFGPARPVGPPNHPAAAHLTASFPFSSQTPNLGPACQPHPLPFLSSPPRCQPTRRRRANPATPRHFPSLPPHQTGQLRQLTPPPINLSRYLPLEPSRDGRGHQWQAPPLEVRSPPLAFLPLALFRHALELLHSPFHPQHTTPRTRAQFHRSAASGSRRRRRKFVAAGEGQSPPPFFISSWVHQGLIKLGLLQVLVPGARGSCASTTPEHRPPTAVAKLYRRRIPFVFELAFFSFAR